VYQTEIETRRVRQRPAVTSIAFYFDPICPWTWITSRWLNEVQRLTDLKIQWKFFSLALANDSNEAFNTPLRVLALVRRQAGNEAVSRLYTALGTLLHDRGANPARPRSLEGAVSAALQECGLSPDFLGDALSDPTTMDDVIADYEEASERYGGYGSPWIVAEGQPIGFNGPILAESRRGDAALDLWEHISWLITQDDFFEIKREHE
jgi:2-hydroxychromene-2-carboxylate isomerase